MSAKSETKEPLHRLSRVGGKATRTPGAVPAFVGLLDVPLDVRGLAVESQFRGTAEPSQRPVEGLNGGL
jgi:hypothetical protein